MRRLAFGASILLMISGTLTSSGAESKIIMTSAQPSGSPAALTATTHSLNDYLVSARLKNDSTEAIVAYRIGWVAVRPDRSIINIGEWMNVPAGIPSGTQTESPAQAVNPNRFQQDTRRIAFFVAEVKFANGKVWKANHQEVKKIAERDTTGNAAQ